MENKTLEDQTRSLLPDPPKMQTASTTEPWCHEICPPALSSLPQWIKPPETKNQSWQRLCSLQLCIHHAPRDPTVPRCLTPMVFAITADEERRELGISFLCLQPEMVQVTSVPTSLAKTKCTILIPPSSKETEETAFSFQRG
ncbi:rCG24903 [Rattus norvegicus]|uniref:RCG24903 n=1 Tax=Rattus norvegicus TaxID=10116 RepID=A6JCL3_RAT|nr:rCG24903 [Rattus norvegicus]